MRSGRRIDWAAIHAVRLRDQRARMPHLRVPRVEARIIPGRQISPLAKARSLAPYSFQNE